MVISPMFGSGSFKKNARESRLSADGIFIDLKLGRSDILAGGDRVIAIVALGKKIGVDNPRLSSAVSIGGFGERFPDLERILRDVGAMPLPASAARWRR